MITTGIAVYNEEKNIKRVINFWLNEPIDEILIVSSGCTDNTENIIKSSKSKKIKLIIEKERKGKPSAINKILSDAKGDIIIMTDGDVFPKKGCTKKLLEKFKKNTGIVAGRLMPLSAEGMCGYWAKISYDAMHRKRLQNTDFLVSGNLFAIRNGIVKKIPEDTLIDDAYLGLKTKQKGYDIKYAPKAIVLVKPPSTVSDFINQRTRTRTGWYALEKEEKIKAKRTPLNDAKELLNLTKEFLSIKGLVYIPLLCFFSGIAWAKAWIYLKLKKDPLKIWRYVKSTK